MKGVRGEVYRKDEKEREREEMKMYILYIVLYLHVMKRIKKENHSRIVPGFVIQLHENI